ncbi:unnamed protein product, partial [Choristocarpus tenellus]
MGPNSGGGRKNKADTNKSSARGRFSNCAFPGNKRVDKGGKGGGAGGRGGGGKSLGGRGSGGHGAGDLGGGR